jgi:amino acid transporter/mannitol/fructose-specific phosphotransferase system IIA component (Ntr-type)
MGLKRELGLLHVFCIASGAMISSGIFILPGLAYSKAGPSVIVCYFLAGLLSIPGMLSLAEMTTAMPKAGGDCFTIIRSMGPSVGTVAGLLSWFSLSMKSAFALIGMSVFTALLVDVDIHVIAVFFCLLFVLLNLVGIKEAGVIQVVMVAGLILLMVVYIAAGLPSVAINSYSPFMPHGVASLFLTTGFVFVSYAGLLKIASVAEEIRDPARNIPLGMILSLLVTSVLYTFMVFVTTGVMDGDALALSLTPISDGAEIVFGSPGRIALSVAAVLAFLSTANAGIMTAARSLIPLSQDGLLPGAFGRINRRFSTPHNAILITGAFVVLSVFLKLEMLVGAASVVLILTNIFACTSVIILRESRLHNYQPRFRAPLYPWMQILGIVGFGFLIVEMGTEALLISSLLIVISIFIYWFYGRIRTNREYALLHLIERITARELTTNSLESELRDIIRERDGIIKDRFDNVVEQCVVLDIREHVLLDEFFRKAADLLSPRTRQEPSVLFDLLVRREKETSTVLNPDLAIPHIVVDGHNTFELLLVRARAGIKFSDEYHDVHTVFVLVGTRDERNFHLRVLSAIAQIVQAPDFEKKWRTAKDDRALRDILLLGKRKRS